MPYSNGVATHITKLVHKNPFRTPHKYISKCSKIPHQNCYLVKCTGYWIQITWNYTKISHRSLSSNQSPILLQGHDFQCAYISVFATQNVPLQFTHCYSMVVHVRFQLNERINVEIWLSIRFFVADRVTHLGENDVLEHPSILQLMAPLLLQLLSKIPKTHCVTNGPSFKNSFINIALGADCFHHRKWRYVRPINKFIVFYFRA